MSAQSLGPNQTKWIAALRSGEFMQGRTGLRLGEAHCCLGVACRVLEITARQSGLAWLYGAEERAGYAPNELVDKVALRSITGRIERIPGPKGSISLTRANDAGATFTEIADFIEANPEAVFTQSK